MLPPKQRWSSEDDESDSAYVTISGMLRPLTVELLQPGYYLGWGTLALINAGIAQGKNRSGLAWFLLSLLFGPLATFILVLLPKG